MLDLPHTNLSPRTLIINYKDGGQIKVPYFDAESTKAFLEANADKIESVRLAAYTGE